MVANRRFGNWPHIYHRRVTNPAFPINCSYPGCITFNGKGGDHQPPLVWKESTSARCPMSFSHLTGELSHCTPFSVWVRTTGMGVTWQLPGPRITSPGASALMGDTGRARTQPPPSSPVAKLPNLRLCKMIKTKSGPSLTDPAHSSSPDFQTNAETHPTLCASGTMGRTKIQEEHALPRQVSVLFCFSRRY